MVLIDGVPVSVPYDGLIDMGKLPLGLVEHVTVVKGAGSLLYGPNGLGGAIHVRTRRPGQGPKVRVSTESSVHGTRSSAVVSERAGEFSAIAGGTYDRVRSFPLAASFAPTANEDGGKRNNSDRRSVGFVAKASWEPDDSHTVAISGSRLGGEFGVPPGVHDLSPRYWRWSDWGVSTVALTHTYRSTDFEIDETMYMSRLSNTLDSYDDGSYTTQLLPRAFESTYRDGVVGGYARAGVGLDESADWKLRGWAGAKREQHAEPGRDREDIDVDTLLLTVSGQLEGRVAQVELLVGLQADGELPGQGTTDGRAGASLGVGPMAKMGAWAFPWLSIAGTVAERTRFPTLRERFSEALGIRQANPDLGPEKATHFAIDAVARPREHLELSVGLFDAEVRDLIIPVVVRPQTEQFRNTGRARLLGAEAEFKASPTPWLDLLAGWAILHARRLDLSSPADAIPYQPDHKGLVGVTVRPWPWGALTLVARHVGTQTFQNPDTLLWGELGSSRRYDVRLDLRPPGPLRVWLRGSNVTDSNAQQAYSYPEPGRQVFAGAEAVWPDGS
jgi:iron complex outermembrane receptor protein